MINTIMNYNPTKIIAVGLCLSCSAYAQSSDSYSYYWSGRIAGIVVGIIFLLLLALCCGAASRRRRRLTSTVTKPPDVPGTNAQPGTSYSFPMWQGSQTYGAPPGHMSNTANMNPYEYPGSQPPPPPYVKGEGGVNMPQETNYSSPPGPPPAAHTRENNHFV
ncbi:uncharacterized protein EDB93DRAFT_889877 [Suillus bovinus]|uniref:uncharacterized protein n=1 Tax=Suillus bovinus TaxID=48563 RepID=UPI001B865DA8|nr:uncharacterized protein EDB93DRAFT_889877 [Suillus bovinus]KAG2132891.1 hypothetical protein EDB93DRAFT_889877 [Suillus bovinus]